MKKKGKQQIIEDNIDYYIAKDISKNTYYICFKNFMLIDIDCSYKQYYEIMEKLCKFCEKNREFNFSLYKSSNGIHVYCMSHKLNYKSQKIMELMLFLYGDFFYVSKCYIRGWSTRLNRKISEYFQLINCNNSKTIYTYMGSIGYGDSIPIFNEYLIKMEFLIKKYNYESPCSL